MGKKLNESLNKFKEIAGIIASGIAKFAKECQEQDKRIATQRLVALRSNAIENIRKANLQEYNKFANAVKRYLDSNYYVCGLKKPIDIEDVIYSEDENKITVNISKNASFFNGFASDFTLDFHFEVSREPFSGNLNDIMNHKPPRVSIQAIEKNMNKDLGKFSKNRGYTFDKVIVDDGENKKVKITVYRVRWTNEEIWRRAGYGYGG